jgi:ribose-phosphate pyrophosphokinase
MPDESTMPDENGFMKRIPIAPLKIASLESCMDLANKVDRHIVEQRKKDAADFSGCSGSGSLHYRGYNSDSYLVDVRCPRFGTGEAKGVINETIRGSDLYIMVDVTNYSLSYTVDGAVNHMSPDDHFQDLKRIISAGAATAHRVNVVMPFLYEGRQHKRSKRESLDCANALIELSKMGVSNFITFDAHDPRVQNAIPLSDFDNFIPTYQFVKTCFRRVPNLLLDKDSLMIISPDEGAMDRAVYLANNLGVNLGMFYKRRDYSQVVNGRNPIVAHEFLGDSVEGKTVIIVDDMISSGESMLDTARELKERKASRVIIFATFGLFTNGIDEFNSCYDRGIIDYVCTTNLNYRRPELLKQPWYLEADMSRYLAVIINCMNHDMPIGESLNSTTKIQNFVQSLNSDGYEYFGSIS